jgi:hypothetical protein
MAHRVPHPVGWPVLPVPLDLSRVADLVVWPVLVAPLELSPVDQPVRPVLVVRTAAFRAGAAPLSQLPRLRNPA